MHLSCVLAPGIRYITSIRSKTPPLNYVALHTYSGDMYTTFTRSVL